MVGQILRNIRKIRKLTQFQVGKEINLAENTISNYETEYSNPTFETIIKFIETYTLKELSKEMDF